INTSAKTKSGFTSEILRTAASPLPTATTSMPSSFRASPTIFWMLLLSSATRIFATEGPPRTQETLLRVAWPTHTVPLWYWSTRKTTRQRHQVACVSEVDMRRKRKYWSLLPVLMDRSGLPLPGNDFLNPFFLFAGGLFAVGGRCGL